MIWKSKNPPIYCFIGDNWLRESDKILFLITEKNFQSRYETIEYTKKNVVLRLSYEGKNSDIERWRRIIR